MIIKKMLEELTLLGIGFIIGLQHAFEPDHVVAVSALISKNKSIRKSAILGSLWGLGHTTTLFIVGALIMLLKITIPETIALSLEFIVGIVIAALGINLLYELITKKKHIHSHEHDGVSHSHMHTHAHTTLSGHDHKHKTFAVGLIHGMAGSAGLMLLVLTTISSFWLGLLYILIFGIGSMFGMAIVSGIISLPLVYPKSKTINKTFQYAIGIISIAFGSYLMFNIGYFEGLLL